MSNLQVTPRTLALLLAALVCLLGLGGWFGLVASQRNSATSLDSQVADAQVNLGALKTASTPAKTGTTKAKAHAAAKHKAGAHASQLQQLKAAFPTEVGMPSILLQVQRLASQSGVSLESFAPSMPVPQSGYDSIAIDVTVAGRYKEIQRFVHALRMSAASVHGRVHATGRLFSVETVGITAAADGLPALTATIMLDAFVYSGAVPPAAESQNTTDTGDGTTTTATTTTPATTTTAEGTS